MKCCDVRQRLGLGLKGLASSTVASKHMEILVNLLFIYFLVLAILTLVSFSKLGNVYMKI